MAIERVFLGSAKPALPAAVGYLLDRYRGGAVADLDRVIIVVPGARAGRRLKELLIEACDDHNLAYWPPRIVTVGQLPELLYEPKRAFASQFVQHAAWAKALRDTDFDILVRVLPHAPDPNDTDDTASWNDTDWLRHGVLLCRQYHELASEGLTFADVADRAANMNLSGEPARWQALATIQTAYLDQLDAEQLWDLQTARVVAVRQREIRSDYDVILLGTSDINRILRQILDQLDHHVAALIHAPPNWQDRFDEYGCIEPAAWQETKIDVPDESITVVEGPGEQAAEVCRLLAGHNDQYRADQISIGFPDDRLVPLVRRRLAGHGVESRWAGGRSLRESGPFQFLRAVAEFVETRSATAFATLVRHPDVSRWLLQRGVDKTWLADMDDHFARVLPFRIDDDTQTDTRTLVRPVFAAVVELCGGLTNSQHESPRQLLSRWAAPIEHLMLTLYGDEPLDREREQHRLVEQSCEVIHKLLVDAADTPDDLQPRVTADEALRAVLEAVESRTFATSSVPDAIELLGWLELPLDDAPALIVTSFHERFVPRSVTSDLFLPNHMREQLGIDDNVRRYARDAYALSILKESRQLHVIVARRDTEGDPTVPSRLLLATRDEDLVERTLRLFDVEQAEPTAVPSTPSDTVASKAFHRFDIPRPAPLRKPFTHLSPTDFRAYLACPYRFYLQRVLRLEEISDDISQMDARLFGTLMHEVLRRFGVSQCRDATDEMQIRKYLSTTIDECVALQFGKSPAPATRIQVEQMRLRLDSLSVQQAARAVEGWRIAHVEKPTSDQSVTLNVDDQPFRLTGRIDRIDIHRDTGQWAIFDYKTGDAGDEPDKVHRHQREWVDLQLPLYRHLAKCLGAPDDVVLGYVLMPRDTEKVRFAEAKWEASDLIAADEVAFEVVRRIRREEFWPPRDPPPKYSEWSAAICMDGVLERPRFD